MLPSELPPRPSSSLHHFSGTPNINVRCFDNIVSLLPYFLCFISLSLYFKSLFFRMNNIYWSVFKFFCFLYHFYNALPSDFFLFLFSSRNSIMSFYAFLLPIAYLFIYFEHTCLHSIEQNLIAALNSHLLILISELFFKIGLYIAVSFHDWKPCSSFYVLGILSCIIDTSLCQDWV